MGWWTTLKSRWKDMLEEYGKVALVVWFTIFGLVFGGFVIAIEQGFRPEGVEVAGSWAMAYAATQLTKPIRIAAVLFLTPIVARVIRREPVRSAEATEKVVAAEDADASGGSEADAGTASEPV